MAGTITEYRGIVTQFNAFTRVYLKFSQVGNYTEYGVWSVPEVLTHSG